MCYSFKRMNTRNIQSFIDYKRSVLYRFPKLLPVKNLISIDGVNASGKDTLALTLKKKLAEIHGDENVVIADITHLNGSPKLARLKTILKDRIRLVGSRFDDLKDKVFASALNRGYEELVIPALREGKIVIMPRSELSLLQFTLLKGNDYFVKRRYDSIADGTISHRLCAGHRIFLNVTVEDQWKNLIERGELSLFDPRSLEECIEELASQSEMRRKAECSPACLNSKILDVHNPRSHSDGLPSHFESLVMRVIGEMDLQTIQQLP